MTKLHARTLAAAIIVLSAVIGIESLGLRNSGVDRSASRIVRPPAAASAGPPASSEAARMELIAAWTATLLARPPFDPTRRPATGGDGPVAADSGQAALPRLAGVMVGPSGRTAIFAPLTGKPVTVSEGGHVGAFVVRRIEVGKVTVAGPDGETVVRPRPAPRV